VISNRVFIKFICLLSVLFYCNTSIATDILRVSIPQMPVHAVSKDEGVLVDFVKVLAKKLDQNIEIQIVPFSRSIYYVITNQVDFHLPFIKPKAENSPQDNFIYSDETIFHVNFVLYTHKDRFVDLTKLVNYKIETDAAHLPFFSELKMGSSCILCSLKKVQHKMTDGYIFADSSTDPLLRENLPLLAAVKRQLYKKFEVKMVFPKTEKGQSLNKALSVIVNEMRLSGELQQLLSSVDFIYNDWQIE
jgi:polar amino acid transport system substrate-binding protein